jgi:hypothetical protein
MADPRPKRRKVGARARSARRHQHRPRRAQAFEISDADAKAGAVRVVWSSHEVPGRARLRSVAEAAAAWQLESSVSAPPAKAVSACASSVVQLTPPARRRGRRSWMVA